MNFRYKLLMAAIVILGVSTVPYLFSESSEDEQHLPPMGIGSPDDPYARMNFDLMRLANPETGEIPEGIRAKELDFAKRLPVKDEAKTLTWTQIGPINKGGRTRAMALDVLNENIILAGGVTGGMYRSTDGGTTWTKTTDPGQMHSVTTVTQDPRPGMENVWYAGTGEYYGIVSATSFTSRYSGDGIFKSTDNGLTWSQLASTASGTPETLYEKADMDFVWKILVDHTDLTNDVVLAATFNGVWRSTDGGTNWTAVLGLDTLQGGDSDYVSLEMTSTGVFYASVSSGTPTTGFWRSDDGITWTEITPAGFTSGASRTVIGINPSDENEVYWLSQTPGVGATGHSLQKYTYISGNGSGAGGNWENRTSSLPNEDCTGYFTFNFGPFNSQSSYDMAIAVHPTDPNTLFIAGTNIYRSTDAFTTDTNTAWIGGYFCDTLDPSNYVYPNHHPDQHLMLFSPSNPNLMYSAHDGGVAKTLDCTAPTVVWDDLNNGYFTTQFYTTAIEPGDVDNDIVIGGMQDNGTWFTNSTEVDTLWKEVGIDDGAYCAIARNQDFYVVSSQLGRMYKKAIDGNGNILGYNRMDPTGGPTNYNFINPFIMDPMDNEVLYLAARNRIWRNDSMSAIALNNDKYNTISTGWTNITQSAIGIQDGVVSCLDISEALPNTLFYGTSNNRVYRLDSANSATPVKTNLSSTEFPVGGYCSSVNVNPHDGDEMMVTYSNYGIRSIFYSSDAGVTFESVSGNLEQNPDGSGNGPAVYWCNIYPTFPSPTYMVGTSIGLFSTTELDGDNTVWVQEGATTIGNVVINMIDTRTYDGKVVVATHGAGMFASNFSPAFVGQDELSEIRIAHHNYPNPFRGSTTIEYMLPQESRVHVEIIDLQGRQVRLLFEGQQPSGRQQLIWDGTNSNGAREAGGRYFYIITTEKEQLTGQMVFGG